MAGKAFRSAAPDANPDGAGWPLEQCAYWLDGALRLGFVLHDEALIRKIRARLDPIVDGVNKADFGTSFIYWKKGYKPEGFNSWAHSQLGRALVALLPGQRRPAGARRPGQGLCRLSGGHGADRISTTSAVCATWTPCWRPIPSAATGGFSIACWAAMAQPAVAKDIQALGRKAAWPPGHMVIIYENIRLPALVYPWSGDRGTSGHAGRAEVAGRQPHAPLRRGLRRGVRVGHRRIPQDRNLRRDGRCC